MKYRRERRVGSLGGSQLVDGFANGWRIDPGGHSSMVVDLEWTPQRRVRLAIFLSVLGGLLCCAIAALGFRRARRGVLAFDAGGDDSTPEFSWPWLPAGEPVGVRTQVLTTVAGAALSAVMVGIGRHVAPRGRRPPRRVPLDPSARGARACAAVPCRSDRAVRGLPPAARRAAAGVRVADPSSTAHKRATPGRHRALRRRCASWVLKATEWRMEAEQEQGNAIRR